MAQTGDPNGDGTGGSGHKLKAEFSNEPFVRGTVAMARTSDPDSADSQFFICFAPAPSLDGKYTVLGQVTSGMEYVDADQKGRPADNGSVKNPDKIVKMQVAADAEKANAEAVAARDVECARSPRPLSRSAAAGGILAAAGRATGCAPERAPRRTAAWFASLAVYGDRGWSRSW